jgi:hypothetical protein
MNSSKHGRLLVALLAAIALAACAGSDGIVAPGQGPGTPTLGAGNGSALAGAGPGGGLPADLDEAYACEVDAWSFYDSVAGVCGDALPFVTIEASEQLHVDQLYDLYEKRGLAPSPEVVCSVLVDDFDCESLQQACTDAAELEAHLVSLYGSIDSALKDVDNVTEHLGTASAQHQDAFELCHGA